MTDKDKIKIIVDDETRDAIDDIIRIFDERFKNPEWANTFVEEIKSHSESTKTSLKNEIIADISQKLEKIEVKLSETQTCCQKIGGDIISVKSQLTSTDEKLFDHDSKLDGRLKQLAEQLLQKHEDLIVQQGKILDHIALPWWKKILGGRV